jgi:hypothetical protein
VARAAIRPPHLQPQLDIVLFWVKVSLEDTTVTFVVDVEMRVLA